MRRILLCVIVASALAAGLISTVNAYSTFSSWGTMQVPYYVNPQNLYVSQAAATTALQTAASAWSTQTQANVELVYAGTTSGSSVTYNSKNEVFFRNDTNGGLGVETYYWIDISSGRLVDADIVFHEVGYVFFAGVTGCHDNGLYIEDLATHEFGHMLGMGHTSDATATMYPTTSYCSQNWRTLDADDIAGIQSLYPSSGKTSPPPSAPSQLIVSTNVTNPTGSLLQTWVDNATNADGYRVERSPDGFTFAQIAQLGSAAISYIDSGLAAGSMYYYRIAAFNGSGMSPYSNVGSGQTQSFSATPPSTPDSPSPANGATGVSTNVTLSWSCSNAQSYDVYLNGTLYASQLTSPSLAVSSLATATTYQWSVVATNSVGSISGPAWSFTTKARTGKGRKR